MLPFFRTKTAAPGDLELTSGAKIESTAAGVEPSIATPQAITSVVAIFMGSNKQNRTRAVDFQRV